MEADRADIRRTEYYRRAFDAYLRYGTRIDLSSKAANRTGRYVWRTREDDKVRPSHAANNGRVFSWSDPPPTGHPGEAPGCRCRAVAHYGATEFANHTIVGSLESGRPRWENLDFVRHFYFDGGRTVTLREIGHLREVVEHYAYRLGAFRRLSNEIAEFARESGEGAILDDFGQPYEFGQVEHAHGRSVVSGFYRGRRTDRGTMMATACTIEFVFSDVFTDPANLRERLFGGSELNRVSPGIARLTDLGGRAYKITGSWTVRFEANIYRESRRSAYK